MEQLHALLAAALAGLMLLAGPAAASIPCVEGVQRGVTFQCAVRGTCQLGAVQVASEQECHDACYNSYECKCGLHRPSDGKCFLMGKTCDDTALGVKEDPLGQLSAIKTCFHCHKTPKWYVVTGMMDQLGRFWRSGVASEDKVRQYWSSKTDYSLEATDGNAKCTCSDQTGWICDFDCGDETAVPAALGEDCSGRRCADRNALCMYESINKAPPTWRCVKRNDVRDKICRTYDFDTKQWDGDITFKTWSCAWYPGRKVCSGPKATDSIWIDPTYYPPGWAPPAPVT